MINFKAYPEPYGWTEFVINGYVYRTDDRYFAEMTTNLAKYHPGKAWNAVQLKCKHQTGEVINGKQVMSNVQQVETADMHDTEAGH